MACGRQQTKAIKDAALATVEYARKNVWEESYPIAITNEGIRRSPNTYKWKCIKRVGQRVIAEGLKD
jgi:hypothetical protein